jgi:hypothetical protein
MDPDLADEALQVPGKDLGGFVPAGHPSAWDRAARDEVVYWAFLDAVCDKPLRPWLIVREEPSAIGSVRFAVPRLAPEAGWIDSQTYKAWEEAAWRGKAVSIPSAVGIAEGAGKLPRGPTRPRWSDPERLVSVAVRADLFGMSSDKIVSEDGEDSLMGERARGVRYEIQRGRDLLAAIGALPWVAMDKPVRASAPWWNSKAFGRSLGRSRRDATNLSWRRREMGPPDDPAREAAGLLLRAPWQPPSAGEAALARGRLKESASDFEGSRQEWLERLIAYPHQTAECRQDLVHRAEEDGSATALINIWSACRGRA